jgi:ferritin-like metal-binding protein YciE
MKTTETKDTQKETLQHTQTAASSSRFPLNSPEATGLRDLFYNGLQDIYWAEKQLTKAIPQMILQATSPGLVTALTDHLAVTQEQVARLEEIFAAIGENAQGKKCAAMEGLIKEGNEIIESTAQGVVRDAGIIAASQKVEHYEIATYGTLCAFAKILGEDEAAELLLITLNEEKDADDKLSEVAETSVNMSAAGEDASQEPLSSSEEYDGTPGIYQKSDNTNEQ